MPKYAVIHIKESLGDLKKLFSQHPREKERKKLSALISLKKQEFTTRQELADDLKVHSRTLKRWLNIYVAQGINELLSIPTRNKPSKVISPQVHQKLEKRLSDPNDALLGYKDAQRWLEQDLGVEIKYNNLYYYLQTHFKSKLKIGRKSHLKKEQDAIASFLKPS